MEFKVNGEIVNIDAGAQSDASILGAAWEIADVARRRGLELPYAAGVVAAEGAMQLPEDDTEVEPLSAEDLKEYILAQLPFATIGSQNLINDLNANMRRKAKRLETVEHAQVVREFQEWFTDEKLAQVIARHEANPTARFTLIATPNVIVPKAALKGAVRIFNDAQPYENPVYDQLYDRYTDGELSGTDPRNGKAFKFGLVETTFAPELEGNMDEQRDKFQNLLVQHPYVDVPSVLEALVYWNTLQAQGVPLKSEEIYALTEIRHFDMQEKRFERNPALPHTFVYHNGRAHLYDSTAKNIYHGRVLIG